MELLQLQYFQKVAHLQHFTDAAREINIAQPALSKTIARLEEDLGVPLFERHGRNTRLSQYGKVFIEHVDRIFMELEEGKKKMQDMGGTESGVVSFSTAVPHVLPDLISAFISKYPKVYIRQYIHNTAQMVQQLESGGIDFGITFMPVNQPNIEWTPMIEEDIFIVVPRGHRLTSLKKVHLSDLAEESFISTTSGSPLWDMTNEFCRSAGFIPKIQFEGNEDVIARMVHIGLGISFVSSLITSTSPDNSSLRVLRLEDPICRRNVGIASLKGHYFSKAASNMYNIVVEYFDNLKKFMESPEGPPPAPER